MNWTVNGVRLFLCTKIAGVPGPDRIEIFTLPAPVTVGTWLEERLRFDFPTPHGHRPARKGEDWTRKDWYELEDIGDFGLSGNELVSQARYWVETDEVQS